MHYEKLSKESLPINMNEKILNKISILRGVKKGDNMGRYPNKMDTGNDTPIDSNLVGTRLI